MNYLFPDYYAEFSCIAGKCPASCCAADWDVEIDPDTREYYESVEEPIGKKIRSLMVPAPDADSGEGSAVFKANDRRCPFFDRDGLCELYLALGEDGFCQTCREYPRYFGEAGDLIQEDLSLSCPEVARLFFSNKKEIRYERKSDIMDGEMLSQEQIELFGNMTAFRDRFLSKPRQIVRVMEREVLTMKQLLTALRKTEILDARWSDALKCMENAAPQFYGESPIRALPEWASGKLMQYFVFRYSIDAMYGSSFEEILNLTKVSLASIGLLAASDWQADSAISCKNIPDISDSCSGEQIRLMDAAVLYSRQIEHSEENVEIMKKC